ncbi:MAG: HAD family hydrolase [Planctomycetota bacterium]|jgi:HAD superfamily hydrolase (TIGR01549 family)
MKIKAVIFDLDGTITEPYFDFDLIRKEMGLDKDASPVWEAMEAMTEQQRRRVEEILDFHEQKAVEESTLNPGAKETLEQLRNLGIYTGVLTRNKKKNALAVAKKHGLEFGAVVGREQGPVKPDAYGVLEICKMFDISCEETMVVGDYLFDLLCAKAAGATAVLLKNHHQAEEFAMHADFCIEKLDEIFQVIEGKDSDNK